MRRKIKERNLVKGKENIKAFFQYFFFWQCAGGSGNAGYN